jgi:hypothetical protein
LSQMIQYLLQVAPTLDDLRSHLYRVVETLNKRAEYTLVANAIIDHLKDLYHAAPQTQPMGSAGMAVLQVAGQLSQDSDSIRVKKLVFCACRNHWQNDPEVLESVPTSTLVQELYAIAPTVTHLKMVLDGIVKTLNRQAVYMVIAQRILQAFEPLYQQDADSTQVVIPEETTGILGDQGESTGIVIPDDPPHSPPVRATQSLPLPPPYRPVAPRLRPPSQPISPPSNASSRNGTGGHAKPAIDLSNLALELFDVRLEVMKFTSPLRAKILIFSSMYQSLDWKAGDYTVLRTCDLGSLLRELLQGCPTIAELEAQLTQTAQQLQDTQLYLQAASAITRAARSLYNRYPQGLSALKQIPTNQADITRVNESEADSTGLLQVSPSLDPTVYPQQPTIPELEPEGITLDDFGG